MEDTSIDYQEVKVSDWETLKQLCVDLKGRVDQVEGHQLQTERCLFLILTSVATKSGLVKISRQKLNGPPTIGAYDQEQIYYNIPARTAWLKISSGVLEPLFVFSQEVVADVGRT